VEDNAAVRHLLFDLASKWGLAAVAAATAEEALEHARRGPAFGFAIVDGQLPGDHGAALINELRRTPHCRGASVALLTSVGRANEATTMDTSTLLNLCKPLKPAQLQAALLRLVSGA